MFRHNIKLAFRNFKKDKNTFLINLIGLSTGLACVLLIYLWVNDEINMDKFHEQDSQLYQVRLNLDVVSEILTLDETPIPLAEAMLDEIPEVELAVATNNFFNFPSSEGTFSIGDQSIPTNALHAGKDFFNIFSFPLLQGNKNQVLTNQNEVVISESLANQLFQTTENVIGKTVNWNHSSYDGTFQVAGVFKDPPPNSTMQFNALFHLQLLKDNDQYADSWNGNYAQTFVIVNKNANINQLNQKLNTLLHSKNEYLSHYELFLQQYSTKYLNNLYENGKLAGGRISYVRLFSLIALFILLIACVNFMNLSTAQASLRMKEIGIKKTIGATRGNLITRLLGESILLSFLALLLAVGIVGFFLPQFNAITNKQLVFEMTPEIIAATLGITLLTGFFAGIYPAFYLSGFEPTSILKRKFEIAFGERWIRKGLVVFQFVLSIIFIVGLLVINQQINLTQTKNMGYDRDNIITFQWKDNLFNTWSGLGKEGKSNEKFYAFREELKKIPGVASVTNMHGNILTDVYGMNGITWEGNEETKDELSVKSPVVGFDFLKTLGIELIEGSTFTKMNNDGNFQLILNEAAVKMMGFENPIGKIVNVNENDRVIGVVKDFHYGSLYNGIEPLIFRLEPNGGNFLVKMNQGTEQATIKSIHQLYQKFHPANSFDFSFLDEDYQAIYESEIRVAALSKYFSGLAILISCLGLFGLAIFTTERRRKEIGIRKVLGSSVFGIIQMLTKDFVKTIGIAILISIPISYLIARSWLNNFAYSIELNVWLFLFPAVIVLLIAWATVGLQTIKAANVNPVESLKNE